MSRSSQLRHRRLLAGWICLVAYLIGGANLVPGMAAALAVFDSDHHHSFLMCDGRVELRLQHEAPRAGEPADAGYAPGHHHSWAARVLCALSCPRPGEPDHVIALPAPAANQAPRSGDGEGDGEDEDASVCPQFVSDAVLAWEFSGPGSSARHWLDVSRAASGRYLMSCLGSVVLRL